MGSNPTGGMDVCRECRVLSGRCLCDELITRPDESYRLWCVVVCNLETSRMGAPYIYDISRLRVNIPTTAHLHIEVIKINIKITPTCFGVLIPSSGSLQVLSAKVMIY